VDHAYSSFDSHFVRNGLVVVVPNRRRHRHREFGDDTRTMTMAMNEWSDADEIAEENTKKERRPWMGQCVRKRKWSVR
jgi:hypothetical protein